MKSGQGQGKRGTGTPRSLLILIPWVEKAAQVKQAGPEQRRQVIVLG